MCTNTQSPSSSWELIELSKFNFILIHSKKIFVLCLIYTVCTFSSFPHSVLMRDLILLTPAVFAPLGQERNHLTFYKGQPPRSEGVNIDNVSRTD